MVDQCYLCDVCYMTKCPYVPPHEWNVDFPHLMLRAKARSSRSGGSRRDRLLSSTDALGQLAGIPVVAQSVNAVNRTPPAPGGRSRRAGRGPQGRLPPYAPRKPSAGRRAPTARRRCATAQRTPGKVALFATCYVNYNEPGIGHDLLKILAHNGIPVTPVAQPRRAAACPSWSWAI